MKLVLLSTDGVLADFYGGVSRLFGVPHPCWGRTDEMAIAFGVNAELIWRDIADAGPIFWDALSLLPGALSLVDLCNQHARRGIRWSAVTGVPTKDADVGKVRWFRRHFGRGFKRYTVSPRAHDLAHPLAILISAQPSECLLFERSGGQSYLWPGVNNERSGKPIDDALAEVDGILRPPRA